MRRFLLYFIIGSFFLSFMGCKNGKSQGSSLAKEDSIAQAFRQDSLERERLIAAKGDTIFGQVCFGMDMKQAQTSTKAFVEQLRGIQESGFVFDTFHFMDFFDFKNIEDLEIGVLQSNYYANRLYKNKLYSIQWHSYKERGSDGYEIEDKIKHLVSIFESKYGKCSEKNLSICTYFGKVVNNERVYADGIIAKWETSNRDITISIEEDIDSDDYYQRHGIPYKYNLSIDFVDKRLASEASKYIDEVVKRELDKYQSQQKQDSIKMVNSL